MPGCNIFDLRRFSTNDGPGIRTSVFFKGCPLRCWWCHNPESQELGPELFFFEDRCVECGLCAKVCTKNAISMRGSIPITDRTSCDGCGDCEAVCPSRAREIAGRMASTSEILAEMERDIPFYLESGGGVTFTGGEPLAQPEVLEELLRACKELGIHTAVDTSGHAPSNIIPAIAKWTDLFLYDLKLSNSQKHEEQTGKSNSLIVANLKALADLGAKIRVRIPIVPDTNDSIDNMTKTAGIIRDLHVPTEVELLPLHRSAGAKYHRLGKTMHPLWSKSQTTPINKLTKTFVEMGVQAKIKE